MMAKRIGILMGGSTAEREVSLQGARAVATALERAGHEVVRIELGGRRNPADQIRRASIDTAFVAIQSECGDNGSIQGLLEMLGIPYTGSGVLETALCTDKLKSKELFRLHNVPTPPYYVYSGSANPAAVREAHGSFGFPALVQPRRLGTASKRVRDEQGLHAAIGEALVRCNQVLVERYIRGSPVVVGILNHRVLGALECRRMSAPSAGNQGRPGEPLSPTLYRNVLNLGERAAEALGLSGAVQVTLMLTEDQNEYVLDATASPVMAPGSVLCQIAEAAGYGFTELCEATLASARLHLQVPAVSLDTAVLPLAKAAERTLQALAG